MTGFAADLTKDARASALTLGQKPLQDPCRLTLAPDLHDLLRRPLGHDPPAAISILGAEIGEPVRLGDDVQVVVGGDEALASYTLDGAQPTALLQLGPSWTEETERSAGAAGRIGPSLPRRTNRDLQEWICTNLG